MNMPDVNNMNFGTVQLLIVELKLKKTSGYTEL